MPRNLPAVPEYYISAIRNQTIDHINLCNRGLSDKGVGVLQELLQGNTSVTSLNLSSNNITNSGCRLLLLIHNLKTVDLSQNNIGDEGIEYLLQTNITNLDISDNGLTDKGARLLLQNINRFKSLNILGNSGVSGELRHEIRKHFIPELSPHSPEPLPPELDLGRCVSSGYNWDELSQPVEILDSHKKRT